MKKVKKFIALSLTAALAVGVLGACGSNKTANGAGAESSQSQTDSQTMENVSVEHVCGTTEVAFSPERMFVLDMAALDTIDALGLGDYVVGVMASGNNTTTPDYLADYYDNENIVVLESGRGSGASGGQGEASDSEAAEDPNEIYYTIDADLIIGGSNQEAIYEVLSEVAPTVILSTATPTDGTSIYDMTKSNASIIASIYGKEAELETVLSDYETRLEAVKAVAEGKNAVFSQPDMRAGGIVLAENIGLMLTDMGVNNLAENAPEELRSGDAVRGNGGQKKDASTAEGTEKTKAKEEEEEKEEEQAAVSDEEVTAALVNVTNWVEEQNPEYLFILDTRFTSLDEAAEADMEYPGVRNLTVYQNGNCVFLSAAWRTAIGGLTSTGQQISDLEKVFLEK